MDTSQWQQNQAKKTPPARPNDSILEALRSVGGGVGKTMTKDVAGRVASDSFKSLFGAFPRQGDLQPGQELPLRRERQPFPMMRRPEAKERPPVMHMEELGLKKKIESVQAELKALSEAIKNYDTEVKKAIDTIPSDPGVYHLNFLDRLRSVLRILRENIQDSRSWLSLQTTRKKKMGYWGRFKKHGTKFGLSSERTMATQAG
ncbi:DUF5660 domain-containing protein [Patescibacteria group bacterium]|nr:DUF5660 domain-containing protein [Patescibacteria group bacterium]